MLRPMGTPSAGSKTMYSMAAIQPGDTITAATAGTTETTFASQATIPADTLTVGMVLRLRGAGTYNFTSLGPSQRPRIRLGTALLVDVGNVGILIAGTPNARYTFDCTFSVRATGTNGAIECSGILHFVTMASGQSTSFIAGPTAGGGETANPVPINTTIANTMRLSTQYSASTAGNDNTLRQLELVAR